jgi:hypothetical protein
MRRPYDIYQHFKYTRKKELSRAIDELVETNPKNCLHNREVDLGARGKVRLCALNSMSPAPLDILNTHSLLVCETCAHAASCSAYTPKLKSREEAKAALAESLKDPKFKKERFPVLVALEWVMDNELHELVENPPTKKHRMVKWMIWKVNSLLTFLEERYRRL